MEDSIGLVRRWKLLGFKALGTGMSRPRRFKTKNRSTEALKGLMGLLFERTNEWLLLELLNTKPTHRRTSEMRQTLADHLIKEQLLLS